jgi:hypothetical protein
MGKTKETANLVSNGLLTPNISDIGIGIGTTNPTAALDVLGDVNITGVITATSFVGNITGGVTGDATGLSGSPSITVTDITASGNVSIAGTLTYEDVTNVDSVGLITARSGIIATGNVGIGTDSNLTANLTVGNIENTSVTNKGALAIKTLSNSDSDIGASAIYIEEPDFGYGFYHKVTSYYGATHHQIQESGSGNVLLTISDTGDIGIKTNYADTFALKILSEDENVIKIENSHNGLFGSDIRIVQDSNSPAANDKLLTLDIRGNDSGGNETTYAEIISLIEDPTNGSEDGKLTIQTRTSGTLTDRIVIDSGGVGIGTTNAVNSDFHVEGRNFSFGGPGDNFSGEGNLYIGNYNNPLLDPWASRNIRIGSQSEIQIELFTDWDGTQYSDSIIFSSPDGLGWQYNANKSGVSRSGIYPMYYSAGNAITDDYLFFQAGNKYLWFDADTGRLGVNRGTGNGWTDTLDVNGTARVTGIAKFDSDVGIGQTNPNRAKLHVVGPSSSTTEIITKFKGASGTDAHSQIALVAGYSDTANDHEGHVRIGSLRAGNGNTAHITFSTADSASATTEKWRITNNGTLQNTGASGYSFQFMRYRFDMPSLTSNSWTTAFYTAYKANENYVNDCGLYILAFGRFEQSNTGSSQWSVTYVSDPVYLHCAAGNDGETHTIDLNWQGHAQNHSGAQCRIVFGSGHVPGYVQFQPSGWSYTPGSTYAYAFKIANL